MALTLKSIEKSVNDTFTDRRGFGIQYTKALTGVNAGKFICMGSGIAKLAEFNTITDLPVGSVIKASDDSYKEYTFSGTTWNAAAGGSATTVENVLTSTSTTNALSSNMGKTLQDTKYQKPVAGIPKTDLESSVQSTLSDAEEIALLWSDAANNGTTDATSTLNADLAASLALNPAPTITMFGKGGTVVVPTGAYDIGGIVMSASTALEGRGARGSSILRQNHTNVSAESATIIVNADGGQNSNMALQAKISDLMIDGRASTAAHAQTVHGIWVKPEDAITNQRSPVINFVEVANAKGNGIHCQAGRDQLQVNHTKSLSNNGWGYNLESVQDLKLFTPSAGRNLGGQLRMLNCGTAKVVGFDIWTGNNFTGEYAVSVESCSWVHFIGGEIQGRVFVSGNNDLNSNANRFARRGITFENVHFKVSLETFLSSNYTSGGGSLYTYTSQVVLQDIDDVKFINCTFGFGSGDTIANNAALYDARPDYFVEMRSSNGAQLNANCGAAIFNGMKFVHSGRAGTLQPMLPFKKHWCNLPAKIDWQCAQPGEYKYLPNTGTAPAGGTPINYVAAGTTGVIASDFPLLYLGLDNTRTLNTITVGTTTFDVPAGPGTAPTNYGKFYRYE